MTATTWRSIAGGLAAALVLALAAMTYAFTRTDDRAERALTLSQAEAGATRAARAAAVRLTSYDYTSTATDFTWAGAAGTKKFQAKYARVVAPIKQYVAELKVHAAGTVEHAAATATDAEHVTVLLFVDQTLASATTGEHKLVTPRITMTMVLQGGRWLVDDASLRNLADS